MTPEKLKAFIERVTPSFDMIMELAAKDLEMNYSFNHLVHDIPDADLRQLNDLMHGIKDKSRDLWLFLDEKARELGTAVSYKDHCIRLGKALVRTDILTDEQKEKIKDKDKIETMVDSLNPEQAKKLLEMLERRHG
jgi:hypothetical protein